MPGDVEGWPAPSLVPVRGTALGARDFAPFSDWDGGRMSVDADYLAMRSRRMALAGLPLPVAEQFRDYCASAR
jgi:hypothetical protein